MSKEVIDASIRTSLIIRYLNIIRFSTSNSEKWPNESTEFNHSNLKLLLTV